MKKPTFFLSSTIYDFRDLRSAIKFYLEEQGFTVLASEFNDFSQPLDRHSYEACFETIKKADYFILLVGGRTGGWYNEPDRISITQQEYRYAYELQSKGQIKLINFVRSEVWKIKSDRRELVKYLESLDSINANKKDIANFPSKFISDAEFIFNFIDEISRNVETKVALEQKTKLPQGNWLHEFTSFKDIIDVLNAQLFSSATVEELTLKRLLRSEMVEVLAKCLVKFESGGEIFSPKEVVSIFRRYHKIDVNNKDLEFTIVASKYWGMVSTFAIPLLNISLHPFIIARALTSSVFLEFNFETNSYNESLVYKAIYRLQHEIRRFNEVNNTANLTVVFENSNRAHGGRPEFIQIETRKLLFLLLVMDRWINIIELTTAIIKYLDSGAFEMPELNAHSPISDFQKHLNENIVSEDEAINFVNKQES